MAVTYPKEKPNRINGVSATATPEPVKDVGSAVTVIDSARIEREQRRTVPDALSLAPGLNVVQTGGPGGQTSVFIRGTNSNQVKVLIDGIDASDPSNANGSIWHEALYRA
jgi:vitamin B12 transporter